MEGGGTTKINVDTLYRRFILFMQGFLSIMLHDSDLTETIQLFFMTNELGHESARRVRAVDVMWKVLPPHMSPPSLSQPVNVSKVREDSGPMARGGTWACANELGRSAPKQNKTKQNNFMFTMQIMRHNCALSTHVFPSW